MEKLVNNVATPVLFLTYRRIDTASKVFDVIRRNRPAVLYFSSNAPNPINDSEAQQVELVRQLLSLVDWPCRIEKRFLTTHLAVKHSVSSAIDWVFEKEESAIILEDDCVPHDDFFKFCDELLTIYAADERVSVITGCNFQSGVRRGTGSYYFSKYNHVWGWGTWRRAWKQNKLSMDFWPKWKRSQEWRSRFLDSSERRYWESIFDKTYRGDIDTWDYAWTASVWKHGGLTITPNVNLVMNIGFRDDSTHTKDTKSRWANMPTSALGPLSHPWRLEQDIEADQYVFKTHFDGGKRRWPIWVASRIRQFFTGGTTK